MRRILRGDIFWADLSPTLGREQAGRRPVLVISHAVFNEKSGTVIAVAITSKEPRSGFPLTLELADAKLPKRSWAKISQVRTLSTKRLGKKLGRVIPSRSKPSLKVCWISLHRAAGAIRLAVGSLLENLIPRASPCSSPPFHARD